MEREETSTGATFKYLENSKDFLRIILDNTPVCVLLLNRYMELQAFNNAMRSIFSSGPAEHLLYKKCGEAIGCANTVDELKECGKTSQCHICELRESALMTYHEHRAVYKKILSRNFYRADGRKEHKTIQYSCIPFYFEGEYYVVVFVEDVTRLVEQGLQIDSLMKLHTLEKSN